MGWVLVPAAIVVAMVATAPGAAADTRPTTAPRAAPQGPRDDADLQPAEVTDVAAAAREKQVSVFATGTAPQTFLIRLADDALPTYDGGEPGLAPTEVPAGEQLDPASAPAREYRDHLVEEQVAFVQRIERTVGRSVEVPFTYQYAVNGIAAVLTPDEAREIAADPSVVSIAPDQERELHTDRGPQWEGAEPLWNAAGELGLPTDIRGEGIVIGTIDTGISPGNSSFADPAPGDGYDHTNPLGSGEYLGVCNPANPEAAGGYDPAFPCNDKLIGAYVFADLNDTAVDYDGHGSHTASTSGGNVVNDVVVEAPTITTPPFDISGVAPHANVISYLGCCALSALTAAIDQAIADGVDVINYSIGSSDPSADMWGDFDTVGFLNARAAGIFVATSNGNDGPGLATTGSPADAPWLTSVGASSHDRYNSNGLIDLDSSAGPLADIPGKSVTGPLPTSTPIVDAAAIGDRFCEDDEGHEAEMAGRIVVCERGVNARVVKSQNIAAQGAVGFVLMNDEIHGDSLLGDEYALPGVFITNTDGAALRAWLATGTDHVGAIAGTTFVIDARYGDIMASFSSRGPNRAVDIVSPSVTAPGVDVLAALGTDAYDSDIHGFISGTSMASPHVAGAGALLSQARPDWSPAEQQSALMTTARTSVLNHDGTAATPYDQGSGHVDVGDAALAGLLFDESFADYVAANPAEGGDPKALNLPSFANTQCLSVCTWTREASVPDDEDARVPAGVTWTVSTTADDGLTVGATLSSATVSPGDTMAIEVSADVTAGEVGETLFGRVTLTPDNPAVPAVTMPVAVVPSSGVLPDAVDVFTRRDAGSQVITGIESIGVSELTTAVAGMVRGTPQTGSLTQDPTNGDPYDDLGQVGVHLVEVPAGSTRLAVETVEAAMPDMDLFVGTGTVPGLETEVCTSTSSGSQEACDIPDPQAGTWWVLVQNWESSGANVADDYVVNTAAVPGTDLGNAGVAGPAGPIPVGQPYDVRFHWDIPEMEAGDTWYGTIVLGSSPDSPGDIGSFPVTIRRQADDVTKTASVTSATTGDTISYEVAVEPNVTPEDLVYTLVDTVPDGLTIDPASVTGGGVVDGQTITWTVDLPTAVGQTGSYALSTPATSPQCAEWGGFVNLPPGIPLVPALDGDTVAVGAFSTIGPFELFGEQFPGLVVSEDGLITVTGGYGGAPWEPQEIPDAAAPNGVIAPLWSDLELSVADGRGMRLAASAGLGAAVIEWDDPFEFTADDTVGPSVGTFQAWVYNAVSDERPEMTFEYETLGALPAAATIGIENIAGDKATAFLNAGDPGPALEDGATICLDYEGPSFEPVEVGYDVTVDAGAAPGTYTNALVHTTDDPYAQPVTVSTDVEVGVECTRVLTGGHVGALDVASGVTCLDGATVYGPITVRPGAGLQVDGSLVVGSISSSGAQFVTVCGSILTGTVRLDRSSAVRFGDPSVGCAPNAVLGRVEVNNTAGPSIIAGNGIIGTFTCSGNVPPPVNNGSPNSVLGVRKGQCATL